ncbi:MAG TPA: flagellar export protein FliJ [Ideonella sp.]|uniref:flagellar export protein FliJ n=1 Tax=Ideonella sp. TaxID=1929293 RepID=UPI002E34A3EA|nr:flagellar export protein FliJ [Ideonella sp.]HEX5685316.1 flagellar export protein FliJ [Ideonella sp.]
MDRLSLLHTLLEREKEKRDAALADWRNAEAQERAARDQAESLVTYRGEYRKRWAAQFAQCAPIEILQCYQGFVERLEQAIGAQQGVAEQAASRVEAARLRLRHRETKVATVQRLIERRLQAGALREQRREQKTTDEAAQRLAWARRSAFAAA